MKLGEYQQAKLKFTSKATSSVAYCSINFFDMDAMLPLDFIHMLACPLCTRELVQLDDGSSLRCTPCGRTYPVTGGIPVLLPQQTGTVPLSKGAAP